MLNINKNKRIEIILRSVLKFYKNEFNNIITSSASGWQYFVDYDIKTLSNTIPIDNQKSLNTTGNIEILDNNTIPDEMGYDTKNLIQYLSNFTTIKELYIKLEEILYLKHPVLIDENFKNIKTKINQHSEFQTNFLFLGGGITSLFFANILKSHLKDNVNIIIFDNRIHSKGKRKVFDRNWLTHLDIYNFTAMLDDEINLILNKFVKNNLIGLPLKFLEAILMIFCKDRGINFIFNENLSFSSFDNLDIDFFIDCTGGRINKFYTNNSIINDLDIEYKGNPTNFAFAGIPNKIYSSNIYNFKLKKHGNLYRPMYKGKKIEAFMFKITGIPSKYYNNFLKLISNKNKDNLFYIWNGNLPSEINELLMFINLDKSQYKLLKKILINKVNPIKFLKIITDNHILLDIRIINLINILSELNLNCKTIIIEPPYKYNPYINPINSINYINKIPLLPIGDSIFCGHPKVGNGLNFHLKFINNFAKNFINII